MLDFGVEVSRGDGCAVVTVTGELDIATAPQLMKALDEAAADGRTDIVVSLLGTRFIDSTGLTTLFRVHKTFEEGDRTFVLVCGPDNVEVLRVMDLMGFDEVFTTVATLADAGCEEAPELQQ